MALTHPTTTGILSSSGTQTPTIPWPGGTAPPVGASVRALLIYSGDFIPAPPAGWTEEKAGALGSTGRYSFISKTMTSGLAAPTWTLPVSTSGTYGKSAGVLRYVTGEASHLVGAVALRTASATTLDVPQVTMPANGVLEAWFGERVSTETSVTQPTGLTLIGNAQQVGGGGVGALLAESTPAAGSTGTKTWTSGVASANAVGFLVAVSPTSGTAPTVNAGQDQPALEAFDTIDLVGNVTGTADSAVWSQVSGPAVTIVGSGTSVKYTDTGSLVNVTRVFRLTASNNGVTSSDDVSHTVLAATERAVINGAEQPMNQKWVGQ